METIKIPQSVFDNIIIKNEALDIKIAEPNAHTDLYYYNIHDFVALFKRGDGGGFRYVCTVSHKVLKIVERYYKSAFAYLRIMDASGANMPNVISQSDVNDELYYYDIYSGNTRISQGNSIYSKENESLYLSKSFLDQMVDVRVNSNVSIVDSNRSRIIVWEPGVAKIPGYLYMKINASGEITFTSYTWRLFEYIIGYKVTDLEHNKYLMYSSFFAENDGPVIIPNGTEAIYKDTIEAYKLDCICEISNRSSYEYSEYRIYMLMYDEIEHEYFFDFFYDGVTVVARDIPKPEDEEDEEDDDCDDGSPVEEQKEESPKEKKSWLKSILDWFTE